MDDVVQYQSPHKTENYLLILPVLSQRYFSRTRLILEATSQQVLMTVLPLLLRSTGSVFHFVKRFQSTVKMPSALLVLAEGAEEMETVITADVLRRGGVSRSRLCPLPRSNRSAQENVRSFSYTRTYKLSITMS